MSDEIVSELLRWTLPLLIFVSVCVLLLFVDGIAYRMRLRAGVPRGRTLEKEEKE